MPAAINLQKITLSGWKAVNESPVQINFDGDSWLIYGGNESGKSSTFSAIRFALFEKPDVSSTYAKNWVNNQTPNGARVELEFMVDGEAYTIIKTRGSNGNGSTILYEGFGDGRSQLSIGTDAVNHILELIGAKPRGGAGGRESEQPQNWGVLAWLLAPQGMDSVTPARDQGTQTIGLERAVSEEMVKVEVSLRASLATQLTPTGKISANSDYKIAKDEYESSIETRSEIEVRRGKYLQLLQDITQLQESIEFDVGKLDDADIKIDSLMGLERDFSDLHAQISSLQGKISTIDQELIAAQQSIDILSSIEGEAKAHQATLDGLKIKIRAVHTKKKGFESEIKSKREAIEALTQQLQGNTDQALMNQDLLRVAEAESRKIELVQKLERLTELEKEMKKLLKQGPVLDNDRLQDMHDLAERFDRSNAMLNALAESGGVSVHVDGELDALWKIDGLEMDVDSHIAFAREFELRVGETTLAMRRQSDEETDWVSERAACVSEFEKHSVTDSNDLRKKLEKERERSRTAETLQLQIENLPSREQIIESQSKLPKHNDGNAVDVDLDLLKLQIKSLAEEKEQLLADIKSLRNELDPLEQTFVDTSNELSDLRAKETASDALAKSAYERRDQEIEKNGVLATREQRLKDLVDRRSKLQQEYTSLETKKETEEDSAKAAIVQAQRVKRQIERELTNKKADLNVLISESENLGGEGLQQALVQANIAIERTSERLVRIEEKVRAQQRLLARCSVAMNDATELEIGPIKDQVQRWLGAVTQGKWTELEMDSKLNVTRILGPSSLPIEGEEVGSGGLKQVIHALIRLAVACKVHDDKSEDDPGFPPVALVMDESQGFVDDDRVLRLVGIFNREIENKRVQVIALSHRRDEFQSLNARNYNVDRREATDDRDLR